MNHSASYADTKGHLRWHANDALAKKLKALHDFLVIGNYDCQSCGTLLGPLS